MGDEDLALLRQVFKAELDAAASGGPKMFQTAYSERGDALEATGLLNKVRIESNGEVVTGYQFTMAGRHAYLNAIHA